MVSKAAKRLVIGALLGAATVTAAVTAAWILRQRPEDPVMPESSELSSSAQGGGEEEISLPPSGEKVVTVLLCGLDDAAQLTGLFSPDCDGLNWALLKAIEGACSTTDELLSLAEKCTSEEYAGLLRSRAENK